MGMFLILNFNKHEQIIDYTTTCKIWNHNQKSTSNGVKLSQKLSTKLADNYKNHL